MNLLPSERSRRNIILSLTQQLKACISFSRHCEGTFGIFLVWGVMSCWISPLWGSRFNTFLAAPVSMILICFHRQAAQTHTILFGIPVKLLCESFSVSLWTYQRSIKGGRRLSESHMCSPSIRLSLRPTIISLHCHISQGHHTGGSHIALSQLKKQNVKGSRRRHSHRSHCWFSRGKSEPECVCHFTGPRPESRIKCERHTKTTLKSMRRRRRVVTPPRLCCS